MKGVSSCILVLGKEFLDIYEFLDICHYERSFFMYISIRKGVSSYILVFGKEFLDICHHERSFFMYTIMKVSSCILL